MNNSKTTDAIRAAMDSDWELAIKLNTQILKDNPKDPETLNRLGRAFLEVGNYKKAIECFNKVVRLDKYNLIAQRNLEKLEALDKRKTTTHKNQTIYTRCDFIEETGKTKVVGLVNLAPTRDLAGLSVSTPLVIKSKRHTGAIYTCGDDAIYLGCLPDDIGHKLSTLIDSGNTYEAFIKSINKTGVVIFIRELTRSKKFANVTSFSQQNSINKSELIASEAEEPARTAVEEDDETDVFAAKVKALNLTYEGQDNPS